MFENWKLKREVVLYKSFNVMRLWLYKRMGFRTKWVLITLMLVVIVVPSSWLVMIDLRTNDRLLQEVERSMQQDAMLFAARLEAYTEQLLKEQPEYRIRTAEFSDGRTTLPIAPSVMQASIIPEAFERLRKTLAAERGEGMFPGGIISMEVLMPDTTLVLSRITHRMAPNHQEAIDAYTGSFDMGGLYPGWNVRVACFNEMKAARWRRYLASIIPMLILIGGVFFTTRMAMREMELSHAKTSFVSNVSHELKTPLAKIQFFNELLRSLPEGAREKQMRYHGIINQECERLTMLVDNVLDFNRIERGQMTYNFADVPIGEVITEVVETFNVMYGERGYHVHLKEPGWLPTMWMDAVTVRQALINLLDNGVKYSEPHTLEVETRPTTLQGQPALALSVHDQGIGIPRDKMDHIFDEFYRIDSGSSQRVSGSGLGLALVRHVVSAHFGEVRVESRERAGSTFTMILPVHGRKPSFFNA